MVITHWTWRIEWYYDYVRIWQSSSGTVFLPIFFVHKKKENKNALESFFLIGHLKLESEETCFLFIFYRIFSINNIISNMTGNNVFTANLMQLVSMLLS